MLDQLRGAWDYVSGQWPVISQAPVLIFLAFAGGALSGWVVRGLRYEGLVDTLRERVAFQSKELEQLRAVARKDDLPARDPLGFYADGKQIGSASEKPQIDRAAHLITFTAVVSTVELETVDHFEFRDMHLQHDGHGDRHFQGLVGAAPRWTYMDLRCRIVGIAR